MTQLLMPQWITAPAPKPEDLNLIPGTHKVEGETPKVVLELHIGALVCACALTHMHTLTQSHPHTHKLTHLIYLKYVD